MPFSLWRNSSLLRKGLARCFIDDQRGRGVGLVWQFSRCKAGQHVFYRVRPHLRRPDKHWCSRMRTPVQRGTSETLVHNFRLPSARTVAHMASFAFGRMYYRQILGNGEHFGFPFGSTYNTVPVAGITPMVAPVSL